MKSKSIIESLVEADSDDYLQSLGIVKPAPAPAPKAPEPKVNYHLPDQATQLALKGDILNDPPEDDFEDMDGNDLLERWTEVCLNNRRIRSNNIDELFAVLGYDGAEDFFQDNEGAVDAIVDWISDFLEKSKRFGDEGWWGMMVQAIIDAKEKREYLDTD